jgi:hypothetical protein
MKTSAIEARARRAAKKAGLAVRKSKWRAGTIDNYGQFQIIDPQFNIPVAGFKYDLSAEEVIEYCVGARE